MENFIAPLDENISSENSKCKTETAKLETYISQIKLMLEALSFNQCKNKAESKMHYVGDERIEAATNLLEISHPDIAVDVGDEHCKVTCLTCKMYLEAHTSRKKLLLSNLSLGNGLDYFGEKQQKLIKGKHQSWYGLKSCLQEHLGCHPTRSGGQIHFKAKQYEMKMKRAAKEHLQASVVVVSSAVEICKIKSAAQSHESLIVFLSFCGADVGNIGHGRKQFPDIVKAAYHYILLKAAYH